MLSPSRLHLPDGRLITLTDGGVFDNLGLEPERRDGAFWAVNTLQSSYARPASTLPCLAERTPALAATPTRLATMPTETRHRLANWGYAVADAALRTHVDPGLVEPPGFPFPGGVG